MAFAKVGTITLPVEPVIPATELRQLYVLKPWQGAGFAHELMRWCLDRARGLGAREIYLSVYVENHRARRFYERYGFDYCGTYGFRVGNQLDEDLIMRRAGGGMSVEVIRAGVLGGVPHGFLGRRGGVSEGVCWGLNVGFGSNDDRAAIEQNRRLAIDAVAPGAQIVTVHQVHSPNVVEVTAPWPHEQRPQADAMVTSRSGLALGILTADCTPVLFADPKADVIGAAHSGWKGAIGGVIEATVAEMERLGADRGTIVAAVGPTIARKSYEVDEGFFQRFSEADRENERFFSAGKPGHHQFDLEGFVVSRLAAAGITRVEALGLDTYSDRDRFFSYRRSTHQGEPDYGRQISLIALPG